MRVPLWLKVGYTVWLVAWLAVCLHLYPLAHLLWLCYFGNVVFAFALWTESPLLFSWQAVALLIPDMLWTISYFTRLALGPDRYLLHFADYMFNPMYPLYQRAASLFHAGMPALFIWGLLKYGYDRRAIFLQLATIGVLYPLTYWVSLQFGNVKENIHDDINWVFLPLGNPPDDFVPQVKWLAFALIYFPIIMFLPSHFLLIAVFRRPKSQSPVKPQAA
jgi:hypothetical protein